MEKTKVTKRVMLERVIEIAVKVGDQEMKAWAENEIDLLNRKNANRKPTKEQEKNQKIKDLIVEELERLTKTEDQVTPICVKDLLAQSEELNEMAEGSSNRVTQLLRTLTKENKVASEDGKKGLKYYYLVED